MGQHHSKKRRHSMQATSDNSPAAHSSKISAYFLAHGSPMLAIEQTEYTDFLGKLATHKPKAVIVFTAHWESTMTTISSVKGTYSLIYDFSGFPKELYQVKYPAKGSVDIAAKVHQVLKKNGIRATIDEERGLDHGSWTLLSKVFPKADVPIVQMSVNPDMDPLVQFAIGKALRDLEDDIMIIGSGVTVHHLGKIDWGSNTPAKWAVRFDDWLIETVKKKDYNALQNYRKLAPHANDAVNSAEHFAPFMIVAGCSDPDMDAKMLYRQYQFGSLSYLCYKFA